MNWYEEVSGEEEVLDDRYKPQYEYEDQRYAQWRDRHDARKKLVATTKKKSQISLF